MRGKEFGKPAFARSRIRDAARCHPECINSCSNFGHSELGDNAAARSVKRSGFPAKPHAFTDWCGCGCIRGCICLHAQVPPSLAPAARPWALLCFRFLALRPGSAPMEDSGTLDMFRSRGSLGTCKLLKSGPEILEKPTSDNWRANFRVLARHGGKHNAPPRQGKRALVSRQEISERVPNDAMPPKHPT